MISAGVSVISDESTSAAGAIRQADIAQYAAKPNGRNQTIVAGDKRA